MKIKKSVKRVCLIVLIIALVLLLVYGGYKAYKTLKGTKTAAKAEIVDKIEGYDYYLEDDATKDYKALFEELSKELKKEEIDEENYAKLISQMLVMDFYNLENKVSKNDIGGTQFILKQYRNNFTLEASETVYKYIEHNVYGNRKQELPEVKSVEVTNVETNKYKYGKITDDKAYIVDLNVEYKKDLGYPKEITVKLIHTKLDETKTKLEVFYMD